MTKLHFSLLSLDFVSDALLLVKVQKREKAVSLCDIASILKLFEDTGRTFSHFVVIIVIVRSSSHQFCPDFRLIFVLSYSAVFHQFFISRGTFHQFHILVFGALTIQRGDLHVQ